MSINFFPMHPSVKGTHLPILSLSLVRPRCLGEESQGSSSFQQEEEEQGDRGQGPCQGGQAGVHQGVEGRLSRRWGLPRKTQSTMIQVWPEMGALAKEEGEMMMMTIMMMMVRMMMIMTKMMTMMTRKGRRKSGSGDRRGCSLLQISCSVETDIDEVLHDRSLKRTKDNVKDTRWD